MQRTKQRFLLLGSLVVMMAVGLTSCLKSGDNNNNTKQTYIFLMHLGPQLPSVDMFFNSTKVSSQPFGFGSVSGTYSATNPGTYGVTFKKGNADSVITTIPSAVYDSLKPYTIILYNDDQGHGQATRIADDFSNISSSKSNYRFFNMSPNIGNVDFYIGDTKVETYRSPGDNVFDDYFNNFKATEPGSYKLIVKEAGTNNILAQTSTEASLGQGYVYTIFLKGLKNGMGSTELLIGMVKN